MNNEPSKHPRRADTAPAHPSRIAPVAASDGRPFDRAAELQKLILPYAEEVLATPPGKRHVAYTRLRTRCYADSLVLGQGHRMATQWASRVEVFTRAIVALMESTPGAAEPVGRR